MLRFVGMLVVVKKSFHYGAYSFSFEKNFHMPFAPFVGLQIFELTPDNSELITDCSTNDYQETLIWWNNVTYNVEVSIRNVYKFPIRPEVIDEEFDIHRAAGWDTDTMCDIDALKALMQSDYERQSKKNKTS